MSRPEHANVSPCRRPRFTAARTCCIALLALLAATVTTARADIDAWYELVSPVGPGTGILSVQQGGPGERLILFVEDTAEPISVTIRFMVFAPPDEPFFAYSVDLLAPDADNVAVSELTFILDLGFSHYYELNAGPGPIIYGASDFSFFDEIDGEIKMFEFVLEITPPVDDDILLFSGIGASEWANWDASIPMIRFADADPLMGNSGEVLESSTPSIVITRAAFEPEDCDGNKVPDNEQIAANPSLDCNSNGQLDTCEVAADPALDCNLNGLLDACEITAGIAADCNHNGVPDSCDIALGTSADLNANGIPDECETATGSPANTTDPSLQQSNDSANGESPRARMIDRDGLRLILRLILGLPIDGGPLTPAAAITLIVLNINGIPIAAVQAIFELISLPVREAIFRFTFAILDCLLP